MVEIKPAEIQIPNKKNRREDYKFIGKRSIGDMLGETIPRELIPNKKIGPILGIIFLIVITLALVQFISGVNIFPLGTFNVRDFDTPIDIGIPLTFLEFNLQDPGEFPLRLKGLIIDLIIYILLAYFINIIINLILRNMFLNRPEEKKKYPKIYKNLKSKNKAETLTKKIFEPTSQSNNNQVKKQTSTHSSEQISNIKENLGK